MCEKSIERHLQILIQNAFIMLILKMNCYLFSKNNFLINFDVIFNLNNVMKKDNNSIDIFIHDFVNLNFSILSIIFFFNFLMMNLKKVNKNVRLPLQLLHPQ